MNNDRELLEQAAKAAGYPTNHPCNAERLLLEPPVIGLCIEGVSTNWNPLTDDGHALRLAVKLEMDMYFGDDEGTPTFNAGSSLGEGKPFRYCIEAIGDDPRAATRRAIVRAAAEREREACARNVDPVDMSPECVEKTGNPVHDESANPCQKTTKLVEKECGGHHHRYAGSFGGLI